MFLKDKKQPAPKGNPFIASVPRIFIVTVWAYAQAIVFGVERDEVFSIDYGAVVAFDAEGAKAKARKFYEDRNQKDFRVRVEDVKAEEIPRDSGRLQTLQFLLT